MERENPLRQITISGICWIVAGLFTFIVSYYLDMTAVCGCPATMTWPIRNFSCGCTFRDMLLMAAGIAAILIGIFICVVLTRWAMRVSKRRRR